MTQPGTTDHTRKSPHGLCWKRLAIYAALIVLIVGGVLTAAIVRGPTQASLLYYQYHAARFRLPPETVVYRFSPVVEEASNPAQFFGLPIAAAASLHTPAAQAGAGDDDDCELLPPHIVPAGGLGDSSEVDRYNRYLDFALTDNMQLVFSHALRSASGVRRIVMVEFGADPRPVAQTTAFEILIIEPATFSARPRVMVRQRLKAGNLGIAYQRTTCYAGQPDAADPSAFHLALQQAGKRKLLTGHLQPDGRQVQLQPDAAEGAI